MEKEEWEDKINLEVKDTTKGLSQTTKDSMEANKREETCQERRFSIIESLQKKKLEEVLRERELHSPDKLRRERMKLMKWERCILISDMMDPTLSNLDPHQMSPERTLMNESLILKWS